MSCTKTRELLEKIGKVEIVEMVIANKVAVDKKAALALVRGAKTLLVAKGKALREVQITPAAPSDAELAELVIGPSGKLRAPTAKIGTTVVVGFSDEAYRRALK